MRLRITEKPSVAMRYAAALGEAGAHCPSTVASHGAAAAGPQTAQLAHGRLKSARLASAARSVGHGTLSRGAAPNPARPGP